ncbi:hypothetical protein MKW94_013274, partial [Papaver nudicaule]|nr:hypothetical protein [Papaver nudicaule]
KQNGPKATSDVELINAGRILENNKTLTESRVPVGEMPGGTITMRWVAGFYNCLKHFLMYIKSTLYLGRTTLFPSDPVIFILPGPPSEYYT